MIGKPIEARRAELHVGFGHGQPEIGLGLFCRLRDVPGIFDERLHPRLGIGVRPRDIDAWAKRSEIEGRIEVRLISIRQPEQLTLHRIDEILALKGVGSAERCRIDGLGGGDHAPAIVDLRLQACLAEIW